MKFELWLAFVAAYTVISLIPGPSVLLVTGIALSRGGKAACLCIVGELVGGVALIGLSLWRRRNSGCFVRAVSDRQVDGRFLYGLSWAEADHGDAPGSHRSP